MLVTVRHAGCGSGSLTPDQRCCRTCPRALLWPSKSPSPVRLGSPADGCSGVVLGQCLARAVTPAHIAPALEAYEHLRRDRAHEVQRRSTLNGKLWHFPDGPEQTERDAGMAAEVAGRAFKTSTNQWSDPQVSQWLCASAILTRDALTVLQTGPMSSTMREGT